MTENSIMWTTGSTGDGASAYTQAELVNFWLMKMFCGSMSNKGGVWLGVETNDLQVTGTASPVSIAAGAASVYGFPYENTATETEAIPTPSAQTRIDRIVLRADWTAQTVRITRIAGTEGAGAPSMTQTAGSTWDIPIAQCSITTGGVITVTDEREFINPSFEIKTSMIEADAITGAKIADDQIDSEHYVDGSIDTAHIANEQVTAAKIANRTRTFWVPALGEDGVQIHSQEGFYLTDATTDYAYGYFHVPSDFVSGLTVEAVVHGNGTGNIYCQNNAYYGAQGENYNNHTALFGTATVALTISQIKKIASLSLSSAAAGDFVNLRFIRFGADASDTINGAAYIHGFLVTYTADG